ncbi:MAG: PQQ-dependent sugar dehydrogenase [Alphaproteobacteria bacterium]|nr:PQQ-dependent sugar dehydrogenase [Alphaproteobacteria bacterium]
MPSPGRLGTRGRRPFDPLLPRQPKAARKQAGPRRAPRPAQPATLERRRRAGLALPAPAATGAASRGSGRRDRHRGGTRSRALHRSEGAIVTDRTPSRRLALLAALGLGLVLPAATTLPAQAGELAQAPAPPATAPPATAPPATAPPATAPPATAASAPAPPASAAPARRVGGPPPGANPNLRPHPARLTVTPEAEIRANMRKLRLAAGFAIELWAHGMPGARMMARGEKGTIFVGTRTIGRVYAVTDQGGQRRHRVLAQGLTQPNGVAFRDGALFVAAINRVLRYDGIEARLDSPGQPVDLTAAFALPADLHHGWKFLRFGPDGKLYVPVGAPCNVCAVNPDMHANIRRYNPDGSGMEVVARGVRNSVGFDFHPRTGQLWFTDNGRDWAGENGPEEELNRVSRAGEDFGFPYCHAQGIPDRDIRRPNPCRGTTRPVLLMGPHAAALGMRFYTGAMFPETYRGDIFVARRGSWNRTIKAGYDVQVVNIAPNGRASRRAFLTGFLDRRTNQFWGRPVDVMQMPDGALLVSDEQNGAIYRISYQAPARTGARRNARSGAR